jgi:hypothetical protein
LPVDPRVFVRIAATPVRRMHLLDVTMLYAPTSGGVDDVDDFGVTIGGVLGAVDVFVSR